LPLCGSTASLYGMPCSVRAAPLIRLQVKKRSENRRRVQGRSCGPCLHPASAHRSQPLIHCFFCRVHRFPRQQMALPGRPRIANRQQRLRIFRMAPALAARNLERETRAGSPGSVSAYVKRFFFLECLARLARAYCAMRRRVRAARKILLWRRKPLQHRPGQPRSQPRAGAVAGPERARCRAAWLEPMRHTEGLRKSYGLGGVACACGNPKPISIGVSFGKTTSRPRDKKFE
jgi:hypothetical protein